MYLFMKSPSCSAYILVFFANSNSMWGLPGLWCAHDCTPVRVGDLSLPPREVGENPPRDRVARGPVRELVAREPPRVLELVGIDGDLAAGVGRDEAHHELARERPVLAADVPDVLHVDADLFPHLPRP